MSHRPQPHNLADGTGRLASIPAESLSVIQRDISVGNSYLESVFRELADNNPRLALSLLVGARQSSGEDTARESAFLEGALTMVAAILREEKAAAVANMLNTAASRKTDGIQSS